MRCQNCNEPVMHNHDDVNFECFKCGWHKYLSTNYDRIQFLTTPQAQGGGGMPTCEVCGHVSVRNNGGYGCLACSGYYELPTEERPNRTLYLMPSRKDVLPKFMSVALILMAGNLVVAGALFFGG